MGISMELNEFTRIKPNVFCLSEGIEKVYNIMFDIDTTLCYTKRSECR